VHTWVCFLSAIQSTRVSDLEVARTKDPTFMTLSVESSIIIEIKSLFRTHFVFAATGMGCRRVGTVHIKAGAGPNISGSKSVLFGFPQVSIEKENSLYSLLGLKPGIIHCRFPPTFLHGSLVGLETPVRVAARIQCESMNIPLFLSSVEQLLSDSILSFTLRLSPCQLSCSMFSPVMMNGRLA
jgi:hypothetical protein